MSTSYQLLLADIGAGAGGISVIITGLWWIIKRLHKFSRNFESFIDDWQGEKARPGVPERPGIMERLSNQDTALDEIKDRLGKVESEVNDNGGQSLKDTVHRVDGSLKHLRSVIGDLDIRVTAIESKNKTDQ